MPFSTIITESDIRNSCKQQGCSVVSDDIPGKTAGFGLLSYRVVCQGILSNFKLPAEDEKQGTQSLMAIQIALADGIIVGGK